MPGVKLGYFGVRGLAHNIRLLLSVTGIQFEEKVYTSREQFQEDKKDLAMDFPNLPYLIDQDFKLSQSEAIIRYIIDKSGRQDLLGKSISDKCHVGEMIGVLKDTFKEIRGLMWNKDYEACKGEKYQKAKPKLEYLQKFIGNRQWALGYPTVADFVIADQTDYFQALYPEHISTYPFLGKVRQSVYGLPQVQKYFQRPNAVTTHLPPTSPFPFPKQKVTIAYWGIRGLGQIPRLLLSYCGVDFDQRVYKGQDWHNKDKQTLGLNFPNLPYLIDGPLRITQSEAINRYIATKFGKCQLYGKDAKDSAKINQIIGVFRDVRNQYVKLFFDEDWETNKKEVLEKISIKLDRIQKFSGQKALFLGYLTYIQFIVSEDSHYIQKLFPEQYKKWSFLQKSREAIDKLPEIVKYYEKQSALKAPFLPPSMTIKM